MAKEIKLNKIFIFHLKLLTSPSPLRSGRRIETGSGGKNMTLNYFIQSSFLFFYSFIYKFVLFLPPNHKPLAPSPLRKRCTHTPYPLPFTLRLAGEGRASLPTPLPNPLPNPQGIGLGCGLGRRVVGLRSEGKLPKQGFLSKCAEAGSVAEGTTNSLNTYLTGLFEGDGHI